MLALKSKSAAGVWVRRVRSLVITDERGEVSLEPCDAFIVKHGISSSASNNNLEEKRSVSPPRHRSASPPASKKSGNSQQKRNITTSCKKLGLQATQRSLEDRNRPWHGNFPFPSYFNGFNQDLRRFLEEVGTDPREARYWLKQFQRSSEPFAVVQVDDSIFKNEELLERLSSALSFLHRNNMHCVVIHGHALPREIKSMSPEELQDLRNNMTNNSMLLVSVLESHGAPSRLLFAGSGVIKAHHSLSCSLRGVVSHIDTTPIQWALASNHIPVIQSIGESDTGQLINVDILEATGEISRELAPLKVLMVNSTGGIYDGNRQVIANVNLPADLHGVTDRLWCKKTQQQVDFIYSLLQQLPNQSSVVITSAEKLLAELFTHHGSGTFFKKTEQINVYRNLNKVDLNRLRSLITKSFGRDLKKDYFERLEKKLYRLYLSEGYNAAAIITKDGQVATPYLDKFAVSMVKQGEGVGELLWKYIRQDFQNLFWRSRSINKVNPWYFKRSDGSWSNGDWIVFWYGIGNHRESSELVDHALALPNSFGNSGELSSDELFTIESDDSADFDESDAHQPSGDSSVLSGSESDCADDTAAQHAKRCVPGSHSLPGMTEEDKTKKGSTAAKPSAGKIRNYGIGDN